MERRTIEELLGWSDARWRVLHSERPQGGVVPPVAVTELTVWGVDRFGCPVALQVLVRCGEVARGMRELYRTALIRAAAQELHQVPGGKIVRVLNPEIDGAAPVVGVREWAVDPRREPPTQLVVPLASGSVEPSGEPLGVVLLGERGRGGGS